MYRFLSEMTEFDMKTYDEVLEEDFLLNSSQLLDLFSTYAFKYSESIEYPFGVKLVLT